LKFYEPFKDSLTITGFTSLKLPKDEYTDVLSFKNTRLHGKFIRLSNDNKKMISGSYKEGIEDSTWVYNDENNEIRLKKYFEKGELMCIENYNEAKLLSKDTIASRAQTILYKYFHLALLALCSLGVLWLLIRSYKATAPPDILIKTKLEKVGCSFIFPFFAIVAGHIISLFIPNSFSYDRYIFPILFDLIFVYPFIFLLFVIVFYILIPKKEVDLLHYMILFSLLIVLTQESLQLYEIIKDTQELAGN